MSDTSLAQSSASSPTFPYSSSSPKSAILDGFQQKDTNESERVKCTCVRFESPSPPTSTRNHLPPPPPPPPPPQDNSANRVKFLLDPEVNGQSDPSTVDERDDQPKSVTVTPPEERSVQCHSPGIIKGRNWKSAILRTAKQRREKWDLYRSRSISPPSTSLDYPKQGNGTQTKAGVKPNLRVSLFYTWSFSGQRHPRPPLTLPAALPPVPDRVRNSLHPTTQSRTPQSHNQSKIPSRPSGMPVDEEGTNWRRSAYSTAPRNFIKSRTNARRQPSVHFPPSSYITDTPYQYRNIFPYTTLCRNTCYHTMSNHQPFPVYYPDSHGTLPRRNPYCTDNQYQYNNGTNPALYGNDCTHPWTSRVEDVEKNENRSEIETATCTGNECSNRACMIGWMLTLTAVIILALAVGLFVQISRESARYEQLQRHNQGPPATTSTFEGQQELHT